MDTKKMSLEERMKVYYEHPYLFKLPMRMPVIMRLDGNCFHSFTKDMQRPFDEGFREKMGTLGCHLCQRISGAVFAYIQSDEISILIHNYKRLTSQAWFANEVQKMVSISAGIASSYISLQYNKEAVFDSRVFVIPEAEVCNYFVWRQQDATRNSIQMCAQSMFSHKQLQDKSCDMLQDMMFKEKDFNWNNLTPDKKRGYSIIKNEEKWKVDLNIPIFTQDRNYIESLLKVEEE